MTMLNGASVGKKDPKGKLRSSRGKAKRNYSSFIYRALIQGHQDTTLDMNITGDLASSIANEAARLCLYNKRRTITRKEIETAVKHVLTMGPALQHEESRPL
ncbi:histone H2B type 2-E-like [Discoglossus pictus]